MTVPESGPRPSGPPQTHTAPREPVPGTDEAIRASITEALSHEHYRRAKARIAASPEEHCAAFARAVMAALRPHLGAIDALWRRTEQAERERDEARAAVQRARDLAEDMRNITGARAWADRLETALTPKDAPTDTTAADIGRRFLAALHLKETP